MKPIYFKLKRVEKEKNEELDHSKFLGAPVFPEGFLDKHGIGENDYFLLQMNLEELKDKDTLLPKEGFLYFFVDVDTYEAKVFHTTEELKEVYDDINEGFDEEDFGDTKAQYMYFDDELKEGHYILGDIEEDLDLEAYTDTEGYVTLLSVDSLELDPKHPIWRFASIAPLDGWYLFLIKEEDLKKGDFSHVKFVDFGS